MNDITNLFIDLLNHFKSVDIADSEFKKMIHEDPELRAEYREWCETVGSSEKMGFLDYCEEYLSSQDSIYDVLNDFDE